MPENSPFAYPLTRMVSMSAPSGLIFLVNHVAWSPNSSYIAAAGDSIVQVWNVIDGSSGYTYLGHKGIIPDDVNGVTWSPDGRRIASAALDKTVQVWNALDGGNVFTYRGHSEDVVAVAWSPDGTRIASASKDVHVWNASDGGNVLIYRGHPHNVNAIAWSPDGKRIVSAGGDFSSSAVNADNLLQVWDALSGRNIYTYHGLASAVAWSPDGTRIASGSDKIQIWKVP